MWKRLVVLSVVCTAPLFYLLFINSRGGQFTISEMLLEDREGDGGDTPINLSSDIDKRGVWQRKQVEAYCRKYNLTGVENQFPTYGPSRHQLFRHLIFYDEKKVLFAYVPKIGCSNTRRFIHVLQGAIPVDTIHVEHPHEDFQIKYLDPALKRVSFLKASLTDKERLYKVKNYFKYTFIRNPLERLLSAYLDKVKQKTQRGWEDQIKAGILKKYQIEEFQRWKKYGHSYNPQVSFPAYIHWIVDVRDENLGEHFSPTVLNIYSCRIKYDFYGNFKQMNTDMRMVIKKLQAPPEYFQNASYHHSGHKKTIELLEGYYSQLDQGLKHQLFQKMYHDLDFYYHLYPEERTSHCKLLETA